MSTTYPGTIDTFTNPSGTNTLDSPNHALQHSDANDALEAIEAVLGTTAGTSVLKDFSAGNFPARVNAGGTLVTTLTSGTFQNMSAGTTKITSVSDPTTAQDAATKAYVDNQTWDNGWIPISETLAYASATTITVASGAASRYQKGDKLKLTQTTDKYFYIVGVADTLLTVTGGSNYTLEDEAITSPQLSRIENPFGFPGWFAWTPVLSVASGTAPSYTANFISRFKISDKTLTFIIVWVNLSGGTAGAGANSLTFTGPVAVSTNIYVGSRTILGTVKSRNSTTSLLSYVGATSIDSSTFQVVSYSGTVLSGDGQNNAVREVEGGGSYEI